MAQKTNESYTNPQCKNICIFPTMNSRSMEPSVEKLVTTGPAKSSIAHIGKQPAAFLVQILLHIAPARCTTLLGFVATEYFDWAPLSLGLQTGVVLLSGCHGFG